MIRITWKDIDTTAAVLQKKIQRSGAHIDYIVGIGSSGLVHAVLLSKRMKLPLLPLMVTSYQGRERLVPVRRTALGVEARQLEGKHILLVDDIIATGETLTFVKKYLLTNFNPASIRSAVAYVNKELCKEYPDYYGAEYTRNNDEWILFPWDDEADFPVL